MPGNNEKDEEMVWDSPEHRAAVSKSFGETIDRWADKAGIRPITFDDLLRIAAKIEIPERDPMTDDQQLIAEARAFELKAREYPLPWTAETGRYAMLIDKLADALSAAAIRYRAEGWDEGYGSDEECGMPRDNPYRALLDENNETQEKGDQ